MEIAGQRPGLWDAVPPHDGTASADGGRGEPAEGEVIRRVIDGERELFELLVTRHEIAVYTFLWKMLRHREEAEDTAQETFVRAFANLSAFDCNRPFRPWLLRIAANLAISRLRRSRPPIASLDDISNSEMSDHRSPNARDSVDQSLRMESVRRAMESLPAETRAILLLHYDEELKIREIGEILDRQPGAVKVALHRARLKLREILGAPQTEPRKEMQP